MQDDRMFSQLMSETGARTNGESVTSPPKEKVLHLSVNLPASKAAIIDRYFSQLYPTDNRTTRSAIIGLALELLDETLEGQAPERWDADALVAYVRANASARVSAREVTRQGTNERRP